MRYDLTTRTLVLALAASAGVVLALLYFTQSGESQRATPFGDAIEVLQSDAGQVAAVVNGAEISSARIQAYLILSTDPGPKPGSPPYSEDEYLDLLIEQELLYQEAVRRGHSPTDEEVLAFAKQVKEGLLVAMEADNEYGAVLRDTFEQVDGTPYHVSAYDSSAAMLDSFRRQLAVNALREEILAPLSVEERNDIATREAVVDSLVADLRAQAEIRMVES